MTGDGDMNKSDTIRISGYGDDDMLSKPIVCEIFDMHPVALATSIRKRRFPPGVKVCGRKFWRAGTLKDWLKAKAEQAVAEQNAVAMRLHR